MILSHAQIEEIAVAVTRDFNGFFYGTDARRNQNLPRGTPIDQFASDYLRLKVSFAKLSADGSLCGLTAYEDTEYIVEEDGAIRRIPLKQNEVLLDSSFIAPGNVKRLCGKRRFTLAHECGHQLLFQLENDNRKIACRKQYAERRAYSFRELKTLEDWNEWQANALGAALLMPQEEIEIGMRRFARDKVLHSYEGIFPYMDRIAIKLFCDTLKVSRTALLIRLRQLGYLEEHPYSEFSDPLEVWA